MILDVKIAEALGTLPELLAEFEDKKDGEWHRHKFTLAFHSKWDGEKFVVRLAHVFQSVEKGEPEENDLAACRRYFEKPYGEES